jgi:teichuronic acid biosynthesis glycosyltransferase TuaH
MFPSHWPVLDYEHKILKDSDGIVATSEPVLRTLQARSSWAKPHMILENGVQADLFSKPLPCPAEFHSVSGRIAIYIGALDERFDWDLIIRLGIELPQLKIYLIGPIGISRKKFQLPENVCAVGPKPYESLPAYLHHACVALLPMNSHPANVGRSPMKIYEYLASGAPVVARHTAELERRNLPGVLLADNSDDFISAVRHVISDNFEKPVKLMSETAEKEDWKSKATIFLNFAKHVKD